MKKIFSIMIPVLFLLSGCQSTIPKDALVLSTESLANRQLQTRKYETKDEEKILAAISGVLQDMGFNLNESETKLGVMTASKNRSAVKASQQIVAVLAALSGTRTATDKEQVLKASVVTFPVANSESMMVRVTFQRIVWNTDGQITKAEALQEPAMYQGFFEKLSKSIFLEAHQI